MTYLAKQGTITDTEVVGLGSKLSMRPDPSTPNTKFVVDRFIGPSADGSYNFDVTSLSCNSATIGAGGRLSGIGFNIDTVYYVYLLGDSTGTNPDSVGFDTAEPAPTTLPAGYDQYRLIGSQVTDSAGPNFILAKKSGDFVEYLEAQLITNELDNWTQTDDVSLFTSNYTKKIYLKIFIDITANPGDVSVDYDAWYIEHTGLSEGQIHIDFSLQDDGDAGDHAYGKGTWFAWLDVITFAGVRQFRHAGSVSGGSDTGFGIKILGHQELI